MVRLDASGRLSARSILRALDWPPGRRVDIAVVRDAVLINSSPTGQHTVGSRGELSVPATARDLIALNGDNGVVLVAAPSQNLLLLHSMVVVARLLADHYRAQEGQS